MKKKVFSKVVWTLALMMLLISNIARCEEEKMVVEKMKWKRFSGFLQSRVAIRLNDMDLSPTLKSKKYDISQMENSVWIKGTIGDFLKEGLDLSLVVKAIIENAYELQKETNEPFSKGIMAQEVELRELYTDVPVKFGTVRVGRQIINWGEADVFRVMDLVNPADVKRGFFASLEEVREPLWMIRPTLNISGLSIDAYYTFDFKPDITAPPFAEFFPYDSAKLTMAETYMKVLAATAGLQASLPGSKTTLIGSYNYLENILLNVAGVPGAWIPEFLTDVSAIPIPPVLFLPNNLNAITNEKVLSKKAKNSQYGVRVSKLIDDLEVSVAYLHTTTHTFLDRRVYKTLPAMTNLGTIAPLQALLTGNPTLDAGITAYNNGAAAFRNAAEVSDNTITLQSDRLFPFRNIIGITFNKGIEKGVLRGEIAYSHKERFSKLTAIGYDISQNSAIRYVLGYDRPTFLPKISPNRTAFLSFQISQQFIPDAEKDKLYYAPFGQFARDMETYALASMSLAYRADTILPRLAFVYDANGAHFLSTSCEFVLGTNTRLSTGLNLFGGDKKLSFGLFDRKDQMFITVKQLF